VAETEKIIHLAKDIKTGFVLQTGLAPGFIDVLANGLFQQFCKDYNVKQVDKLECKVGALTTNAVAPHYYGFTWSTIGVATEYIKDAVVLRDFKRSTLPSLSERASIIINGIAYEEDLTSGGAADLPEALSGKVRLLDYKTLRHPGHYSWIENQISELNDAKDIIKRLHKKMEAVIPHIEDDQIVFYTAVEGKDSDGILRRKEIARQIFPQTVGKHKLRAIQITTATPLVQSAQMLLESVKSGIILQSQIDPIPFLNGNFITSVYGKTLI
jgi:saccharopine dehydrogenase-like NADP-dependent oxidoreductase